MGNIASLELADLARALLFDLIDAKNGMHRQISSRNAFKFGFYLFLRGIDDHRAALAENELLHFDETEQVAVTDITGINLVNLSLAREDDLVDTFG